ncbi:MAG: LysR substrate-binding domain-containing protein [Oligoflexus sp.]
MLTDELANGRLMKALPNWRPHREAIHVVYPSRRGLLPSVRILIEFFAEKYAQIEED